MSTLTTVRTARIAVEVSQDSRAETPPDTVSVDNHAPRFPKAAISTADFTSSRLLLVVSRSSLGQSPRGVLILFFRIGSALGSN